jgi:hypothetical protein
MKVSAHFCPNSAFDLMYFFITFVKFKVILPMANLEIILFCSGAGRLLHNTGLFGSQP